ncbi:MAG: GTP cyclohydrolase FolE2, partial [Gammaproteobacteria bacterium]
SHEDISDQAKLVFSFNQMIKQPALISQYSGWKSYPVTIIATLRDGHVKLELSIEVTYSSTCPCSAALARQIIHRFHHDFRHQETVNREVVEQWLRSENGTLATPHSQRSVAKVRVHLTEESEILPITALVADIENTLKTPVQTAVKREDEQEFARLNGQNLMFCEDAARQLKSALIGNSVYQDFWLQVNHLESLHAHNAVSIATCGVPGGYQALVEDSH